MFLFDELIRLEALTLLSISAVHKPFYILICISEHCLRSTLRLFHYNELAYAAHYVYFTISWLVCF